MRHDALCSTLDRVFGLSAPIGLDLLGADLSEVTAFTQAPPRTLTGAFVLVPVDRAEEQAQLLVSALDRRTADGELVGHWAATPTHALVGVLSVTDSAHVSFALQHELPLMPGSSWVTAARPRWRPPYDVLDVLMALDEAPLLVPAALAAQGLIGAADPATFQALIEDRGWHDDAAQQEWVRQVANLTSALVDRSAQRPAFLPLLPGNEAHAFQALVLDAVRPQGPVFRGGQPAPPRPPVEATPATPTTPAFGADPLGVDDLPPARARRRGP